jgi:hypothetical protein
MKLIKITLDIEVQLCDNGCTKSKQTNQQTKRTIL